MKVLFFIMALLVSSTCFADFMSERDAVTKFEKEEFLNDKNYPPARPGQVPEINKAFADKLINDPVKLKYFVFLGAKYRFLEQVKNDKSLAISLESKFGTNKLKQENLVTIVRKIGQFVFDDSNSDHKKAFQSKTGSDEYYKKILSRINSSSFK